MEVNKIYKGHSLTVLKTFPDNIVDCIVTSPPYYNLRKYGSDEHAPIWNDSDCEHEWQEYIKRGVDGGRKSSKLATKGTDNFQTFDDSLVLECIHCNAVKCELGQEPSSDMFIKHLVEIFRECRRVLKPTGTLWVNIGDSYMGSGGKNNRDKIKDRSLMLIPQRLMIALVEDGWIMRNDVVWYKPDCMPHPDDSKNTPSHEHIYVMGYFPRFVQQEKYYYKQLISPLKTKNVSGKRVFGGNKHEGYGRDKYSGNEYKPSKLGVKNMRDTWLIRQPIGEVWKNTTAKYSGAHFATFPFELPMKAIEASVPRKICSKCGQPVKMELRKVEDGDVTYKGNGVKDYEDNKVQNPSEVKRRVQKSMGPKKWVEVKCKCNAPFRPGIVLDPFMGSGTTAIAALQKKVNYIGIELFYKNVLLSEERIKRYFPMKDSDSLWEV